MEIGRLQMEIRHGDFRAFVLKNTSVGFVDRFGWTSVGLIAMRDGESQYYMKN